MLPKDNASVQSAELYLEVLHPQLRAAERIEIRHGAPRRDHGMRRAFVATTREAAVLVVSLGESHDVYAGVAARLGNDGTKKGVCRASALWADLDARDGHTRESRLRQLAGLPCHPSMLVWTGAGFHPYWSLRTPAEGPEELKQAERIMQRLAVGLDGDPVHDRSRILRIPGAFNHKYGEPRRVEIEHCEPAQRYDLAEIQEMAESLTSGSGDGAGVAGGEIPHEVLSEPIRQHRRNLSLTSVAGSLRDRGLDAETIRSVLIEVNRVRCLPPLEDEEVSRIARSIGRYPVGKPRYRKSAVRRVHPKKKER